MKRRYFFPVLTLTIFDTEILSKSPALVVNGAGDDNAGYDLDWYQ